MNDYDRAQWVDNDEGLYNWWHRSGQPKSVFIREHRVAIDKVIDNVTNSRRPAHYLAYDGNRRTRRRGRSRSRWAQPLTRNEKLAVGALAVVGAIAVVKSIP